MTNRENSAEEIQITQNEDHLPPASALLGHIIRLSETGQPIVRYQYKSQIFEELAVFTCAKSQLLKNASVVLLFIENNIGQPIISGVLAEENSHLRLEETIRQTEESVLEASIASEEVPSQISPPNAEHLIIENKDGITLRTGKSTITLTPDGYVLINGRYITAEASKVNRITGGTVKIN